MLHLIVSTECLKANYETDPTLVLNLNFKVLFRTLVKPFITVFHYGSYA